MLVLWVLRSPGQSVRLVRVLSSAGSRWRQSAQYTSTQWRAQPGVQPVYRPAISPGQSQGKVQVNSVSQGDAAEPRGPRSVSQQNRTLSQETEANKPSE